MRLCDFGEWLLVFPSPPQEPKSTHRADGTLDFAPHKDRNMFLLSHGNPPWLVVKEAIQTFYTASTFGGL